MKFLCGSCRTKYQISDDKVRGKILTIRCKKCGAKILVRESLVAGGGTAVAPVAEEEVTLTRQPAQPARQSTSAPAAAAAAAAHGSESTPRSLGTARTGGSAALASAYELAMGQSASDSDDMPTSIAPVPANLEIAGVEWYAAVDGTQQGPFAFAEVVQKVESGQLIGRHYVWHDGMDNWTRLREVADLAKYLPTPRSVPPPPPAHVEDQGPSAEVVELAAHRAQLSQDLLESGATSIQQSAPASVVPSASADAAADQRADELDRALNDVLGFDDASSAMSGPSSAALSAPSSPALSATIGATQDVEEDMLSADDMFANIPRASQADEVHRESTRFFVAAAGVNKQRKRRRIGMIAGSVMLVFLIGFLGGWAAGLFSISLPGIGDPFANMRQGRSPTEAGPAEELTAKELALLKGKKKRARRRSARRRRGADVDLPSGEYVDEGDEGIGNGTRGAGDAQKVGFGRIKTGGGAGAGEVPDVDLPTSSPDMPVVDQSTLTQDSVARVVKQNSMSVRFCYQQSLKGSKNLRGKLQIKLRVAPSGKVTRTEVKTSQFKGTTLARCISDKIRKWSFPRFEGEPKEFLVPFVLEKAF